MSAIIKTVNGLALASMKSFNGLAAASLKTINGQDATSGASYLVQQDFTNGSGGTIGAPVSGSAWTVDSGTWTFNNTSPALPQGGNNAKNNSSFGGVISVPFTGLTEGWAYFEIQFSALPSSGAKEIFHLRLSDGTEIIRLSLDSTGKLTLIDLNYDGVQVSPADVLSVNTNYRIWIHWHSLTSSTGVMDIGFSTTGTRPTSGTKFASASNCNLTSTLAKLDM